MVEEREGVPAKPPAPRLCHIVKRSDFDGFGFNLYTDKESRCQCIGKVDRDSPAEAAQLRRGDRIVEVNGVNIANENHKQVSHVRLMPPRFALVPFLSIISFLSFFLSLSLFVSFSPGGFTCYYHGFDGWLSGHFHVVSFLIFFFGWGPRRRFFFVFRFRAAIFGDLGNSNLLGAVN